MSSNPNGDPSAAPAPPAHPVPRRQRLLLVSLLLLVVASTSAIVWWRLRPRVATPPAVPAEGLKPEVAASLTAARNEVLNNPKSGEAWGRLGLRFTANAFDDQAAECYREAHRLDATDARWPYFLGLYYRTDGRDLEAAAKYLEAALACPHPHAWQEGAIRVRLAELYLEKLQLAEAERLFRFHLSHNAADPRALVGLGITLLTADRPAEAIPFLKQATDSPFTRQKATTSLAAASRRVGDHAAAAQYEQQAAALSADLPPPDPFVAEAAALRVGGRDVFEEVAALEKEGRIRETIPLLLPLAEDSGNVRAAVLLGQHLSLLGEHASAERYLRAACTREPENVQAAVLLATVLFDLAQAETTNADRKTRLLRESADTSALAIKLNPSLGMAHFSRAMALQELGDRPAALPHFRLAVECRPEVPQFQLGLLTALVDSGMLDEARKRLPIAERVIPAEHPRLVDIRKRLAKPTKPEQQPR